MSLPLKRPFIVGHRGLPSLERENTLSSFKRAIECGVDLVEFDVRRAKDGLVVFHDKDLKRLFSLDKKVIDCKVSYLTSLGVNTLQEVLNFFKELSFPFLLEVKEEGMEEEIAEEILRFGLKELCTVISFLEEPLKIFKGFGFKTGLIYSRPPGKILRAKELGCEFVLPAKYLTTKRSVSFAHRLKLKVITWTVNEVEEAKRLSLIGVDGIATDEIKVLSSFIK